jgi:hypothetical protein
MMFQLDGSQNELDAKQFLGRYAEGVIGDIRRGRQPEPGDEMLRGHLRMDLASEGRYRDYS